MIKALSCLLVVLVAGCQATQTTVINSWTDGEGKTVFNGKIEVTVASAISGGWTITLTFNAPTEITACYQGQVTSGSGYKTTHTITNFSYNANWAAGTTLTVQFAAKTAETNPTTASVNLQASNGGGGSSSPTSAPTPAPTPAPTNPPSTSSTTTTTTSSSSGSGNSGNSLDRYSTLLSKSILFYAAQRSGDLPAPGDLPNGNPISWRGDAAENDGEPTLDLSGGWFDAGDYVKFNFPMAWSVTVLAWGILEFKNAYVEAGEYENALDSIKWPLEYLIKCHPSANELYVQVGNGFTDHSYFGRPEQMSMARPILKVDAANPGADIAAETAAAFAASYLVFKDEDATFAEELLDHAKELYTFAKNNHGKYSDMSGQISTFYASSKFKDELAWGAAWLYRATDQTDYLTDAETMAGQLGSDNAWAFSWDDKKAGVQLLLYQLGQNSFKSRVENFLSSWGNSVRYTPQGLAWLNEWGPNRYAANTAAIAIIADKAGISVPMGSEPSNKNWAKKQIDLLTGDSGRSYVVGYKPNNVTQYPKRPHHRASACPKNTAQNCDQSTFNANTDNPNILQGALVGGPDQYGNYKDDRTDYVQSEVACDYNAGFQTAVAGVKFTFV